MAFPALLRGGRRLWWPLMSAFKIAIHVLIALSRRNFRNRLSGGLPLGSVRV